MKKVIIIIALVILGSGCRIKSDPCWAFHSLPEDLDRYPSYSDYFISDSGTSDCWLIEKFVFNSAEYTGSYSAIVSHGSTCASAPGTAVYKEDFTYYVAWEGQPELAKDEVNGQRTLLEITYASTAIVPSRMIGELKKECKTNSLDQWRMWPWNEGDDVMAPRPALISNGGTAFPMIFCDEPDFEIGYPHCPVYYPPDCGINATTNPLLGPACP